MAKPSSTAPAAPTRMEPPDPFGPEGRKQLATRLGLPVLAVWVLGGSIAGISQSRVVTGFALGIPAILTAVALGLVVWGLRQATKARGVAGILSGVQTEADRKAALAALEAGYAKNDPAAVFGRAQLLLQEDPRKALEVLQEIDLGKVLPPVADEARAQRAMIHLLLGEVTEARDLADAIDLSRQSDARARAMMGAVVAEAWARTGQGKRARETLEIFNAEDPALEAVAPQLHRARAFVYAGTEDVPAMKRALRRLLEQDPRLLGGFMQKRVHPLLQKEAKRMLEQSGAVPRRMNVQR